MNDYMIGYLEALKEVEKIIDKWADTKEGIYNYQKGIYDINMKDIEELKQSIKKLKAIK